MSNSTAKTWLDGSPLLDLFKRPRYCADSAPGRFGVGESVNVKPKPPFPGLDGIMTKTKDVLKEHKTLLSERSRNLIGSR